MERDLHPAVKIIRQLPCITLPHCLHNIVNRIKMQCRRPAKDQEGSQYYRKRSFHAQLNTPYEPKMCQTS